MKLKKYLLFSGLLLLAGAGSELGHYHESIWTTLKIAWSMRNDSTEVHANKLKLINQILQVKNLNDIQLIVEQCKEDKNCSSILESPGIHVYIQDAQNYYIQQLQKIVGNELSLLGFDPYLFDFRKGLNVTVEDDETALHYLVAAALKRPLKELAIPIHMMVINGANVNARNIKGQTPLMFVVIVQNTELVDYLINGCYADISVKDKDGKTALDYAREIARKAQDNNEKSVSKKIIDLLTSAQGI